MADWNHPQLGDPYPNVLQDHIMGRDVDAITLQKLPPSNLPNGAMKYDRNQDLFTEWDLATLAFINKKLSILGGGTGANSAPQARTNLGLGSMATQDSTNVLITGGNISGVTLNASTITAGTLALARGGTGSSLGIGASGTILESNGVSVIFGTDGSQLANLNASNLSSGSIPAARLPVGFGFPTGLILAYAGVTAPTGFIACDGSAISRITFSDLFVVIGITYGAGDGATTFNIPDLRQRFPLGKAAGGTGSTLGSVGGAIDHNHVESHSHTVSGNVAAHQHTTPAHTHNISARTSGPNSIQTADNSGIGPAAQFGDNNHTHGLPATDSGGSGLTTATAPTFSGTTVPQSTGNVTANPPYQVINYIIKT